MSVWVVFPSKRSAGEAQLIIDKWHAMGYLVAIWRDAGDEFILADAGFSGQTEYPGYYECINRLARHVLKRYPETDWIVAAADDTEPDPNHRAEDIARECGRYFGELHDQYRNEYGEGGGVTLGPWSTFGVMQPTGDGHGIETICGSPWLGREWCERAYGGVGPTWPFYKHMFGDQDLQEVAKKNGVLWQRPDLTHHHMHWSWQPGHRMPEFAAEVNSPAHWDKYKRLFSDRQAAGFPGSEPLRVRDKVTA